MKRIVMLALLLAMVSPLAQATESRDAALQADKWMVEDDTNIQLLPAELNNYKDQLYFEMPYQSDQVHYGGAHVGLGPGILALYLGPIPFRGPEGSLLWGMKNLGTTPVGGVGSTDLPSEALALLANAAAPGRFSALYGLSMSGGTKLAFGLDYWGRRDADDTSYYYLGGTQPMKRTEKSAVSLLDLNAGVSMPLGTIDPLSIGIRLGLPSFEGAQTDISSTGDRTSGSFKKSGGVGLQANIRAKMANLLREKSVSYLYCGVDISSLKGEGKATFEVNQAEHAFGQKELKSTAIEVGLATNHTLAESTLLYWSAAFMFGSGQTIVTAYDYNSNWARTNSEETKSKSTLTGIPLTVGVESKLFKWLTARASSRSYFMYDIKSTASVTNSSASASSGNRKENTAKSSLPPSSVAVGATVNLGDKVGLDGVLIKNFLFSGPNFVGGDNTGLFSQISLSYRFE